MTAHVDFTTLQQVGAAAGLSTLSLTRQMGFLVDLGIGDLISGLPDHYAAEARAAGVPAAAERVLQARARLFRLIDPDGLGRFHVLIQGRGLAL